ncbi:MAG TPA: hypothetical protein VKA92_10140, partial [Segetibacter sp.]|nr:hypothetical protein [Segetibacter sp.]
CLLQCNISVACQAVAIYQSVQSMFLVLTSHKLVHLCRTGKTIERIPIIEIRITFKSLYDTLPLFIKSFLFIIS